MRDTGHIKSGPQVKVRVIYGAVAVKIGFLPHALGQNILRQVHDLDLVQRQIRHSRSVRLRYRLEDIIIFNVYRAVAVDVPVHSFRVFKQFGVLIIHDMVLVDVSGRYGVRSEHALDAVPERFHFIKIFKVLFVDDAIKVKICRGRDEQVLQHVAFVAGLYHSVVVRVDPVEYVALDKFGSDDLGKISGIIIVHPAVMIQVEV